MKKVVCFIFCLIVSNFLYAQTTKKIDSLKCLLLDKDMHDTTRVGINYLLSVEYADLEIDKSKLYATKALEISLKTDNYGAAGIYLKLGVLEFENSNMVNAHAYYDKALKVLDLNDDKDIRLLVYGNYSVSYQNTNNFEKALEYNLKAIELSKDKKRELCFLYFNHSIIYEDAGFHDESIKYLDLAYKISKEVNDYRVQGYSLRNLAHYAIEDKDFALAKIYLSEGEIICETSSSKEICGHIYLTLGRFYSETGVYDKAELYFLKGKEIAQSRQAYEDVFENEIFLGDLEFKKGNYKKSVQIFNKINVDKNYVDDIRVAKIAYRNRSKSESEIGNYKKSNQLLMEYLKVSDSIQISKNRKLLIQADRKYETAKKDKEIVSQQLELKEQESEIQKKKALNTYMLGLVVFLLVASVLLLFLFKQRQKRKNQEILTLKREVQIKILESLIEGEEKERFRIAKELHDGVNGDLSAIKYKLSSLLEMNNKVIKEAITMIDDSCKQVRAISHNLVPPSLEKFNLVEVVEVYCNNLNGINPDVEFTFQHLGGTIDISKKVEVNIFRIIQELISNSIKHADASSINVQISSRNNTIQVTIEDDGKGFDKDEVTTEGIGLSNVQSRIDYLKASVDFISNEKGTSYTIDIDKTELNDN